MFNAFNLFANKSKREKVTGRGNQIIVMSSLVLKSYGSQQIDNCVRIFRLQLDNLFRTLYVYPPYTTLTPDHDTLCIILHFRFPEKKYR